MLRAYSAHRGAPEARPPLKEVLFQLPRVSWIHLATHDVIEQNVYESHCYLGGGSQVKLWELFREVARVDAIVLSAGHSFNIAGNPAAVMAILPAPTSPTAVAPLEAACSP